MAKIKIQGNASGTGTLTLTAPNTNADRTITLPDEDITLGGGVDGIVSTATGTAITIDSSEKVEITRTRNNTVGEVGLSMSPSDSTIEFGYRVDSTNNSLNLDRVDSPTAIMTYRADGKVGIGVTPKSWNSAFTVLEVGGNAALYSESSIATGYNQNAYKKLGADWAYMSTNEASWYEQYNGKHIFKVAPSGTADSAISWTAAIIIDNNGQLKTESYVSNSSGHGCQIYSDNDQGQLQVRSLSTANRDVASFANPNGRVGKISTSGTSTSFVTSSDYRLKENVVPMTGSIDRLKQLNPSNFNFIADADTTVDGFLAHEAQEVVSECVVGAKDAMMTEEYEVTPAVMDGEDVVTEAVMGEREVPDMQGIDQSKLVPLLVASLQEAIAKIEELTTRIETLETN